MELLRDGLTFDCSGLAPGPAATLPSVNQWLGVAEHQRPDRLRCVGLSLGPHLRAGQASPSILRSLLELARDMADGFSDCRGLCWVASGTVIDPAAFADLLNHWRASGSFPVQLVASLKDGLAGGVESRGMAYFTGQELRLEPGAAPDQEQSAALALRLASQLIHRGRLDAPEQAMSPHGTPLRLEPSPNGRFVRVWAG